MFCWELSDAGPGLFALPRSKPLRFRFSSTPQSFRLGWPCVLCPSQVQAAQVIRCLASASPPGGWCVLWPPPSQPFSFLGVQLAHFLRCAVCLFWGADIWLQPSRLMSSIQNPKKSWLAMKPACSLVVAALLGPRLTLSSSGCPSACLSPVGDGLAAAC